MPKDLPERPRASTHSQRAAPYGQRPTRQPPPQTPHNSEVPTREQILAGPSRRTLEERLREPTLQERLHTPIAPPREKYIDFSKFNNSDLARIFAPKISATLKRFDIFETLETLDVAKADFDAVFQLRERLAYLQHALPDIKNSVTRVEFRHWKAGLRTIGEVSFKGLRRNRVLVFRRLAAVWRNGYFDKQ